MKNPFLQWISTKNLYLVTLRNVSHIGVKAFKSSVYFFGKKKYAFAKRLSYGNYVDIFTGTIYYSYDDPILGSGNLAVGKADPINIRHLFVSKNVLQQELNELNAFVEDKKPFTKNMRR